MIDDPSTWTIVGIDCASQDANIGLARGTLSSAGLLLESVRLGGSREASVAQIVTTWLQGPRVLLAIDAPLGWPRTLADALQNHHAGQPIAGVATRLMRRETDRQVAAALRKTPLDVAADRIAYAAHRALRLLGELREMTGQTLPLLWSPTGTGAIEVYPAATLRARSIDASGYKKKTVAERLTARSARERLLGCLAPELTIAPEIATQILAAAREDMLDAAICVLAGADFLRGRCAPPGPAELPLAQREGWIWFRRPDEAKAGEQKAGEQKAGEQKAGEQKGGEQKGGERDGRVGS